MSLQDHPDSPLLQKRPNEVLIDRHPKDRYDTLIGVIMAFAMAIGVWVYAIKPSQTAHLQAVAEAEKPSAPSVAQPVQAVESKHVQHPVAISTTQPLPAATPVPTQQQVAVMTPTPENPFAAPPQAQASVAVAPPAMPEPVAPPAPVAQVSVAPVVIAPPPAPEPPPPVEQAPTAEPAPLAEAPAPQPPPSAAPVAPIVAAAPEPLPPHVVIRESFEFEMGQARIPESAKPRLLEVAELLKNDTRQLKIVGHTDNIGFTGANQRLSLRRANAVKAFLVAAGVNAQHLGVEGMGESQPIGDNQTVEGRNRNRRIEIIE